MQRKIYLLLFVSILAIAVLTLVFSSPVVDKLQEGSLSLTRSRPWFGNNDFTDNQVYYLGHDLVWDGMLNPTLEKIEVYSNSQPHSDDLIAVYIDTVGSLVLAPDPFPQDSEVVNLVTPVDHTMDDKRAKVVFKFDTGFWDELGQMNRVDVTYKVLGKQKVQSIDIILFPEWH
ncbi:MAG: hypothetical protein FH749_11655 [Firmicutes bacterium]|nr:hypothetical protein [Bacillota bacterium]